MLSAVATAFYSNTTLVKVKYMDNDKNRLAFNIQIQLLLKLN